jgi:DNA-binding CsgD family transcriptional regulator
MIETSTSHWTSFRLASFLDSLFGVRSVADSKTHRLLSLEWQLADTRLLFEEWEYLILRRDVANTSLLTSRERKTVRLAMGQATNKEIAWALGVSPSTVGVFLWRAARKLGVTGRNAMLKEFKERYPDDQPIHIAECKAISSVDGR